MSRFVFLFTLFFLACGELPKAASHEQYDAIISKDLSNKQQELEILREIFRAQEHNDEEAFKFYLDEYMYIERLALTEEQKKHPKYKAWLTDEEIKSGVFMEESYNYE